MRHLKKTPVKALHLPLNKRALNYSVFFLLSLSFSNCSQDNKQLTEPVLIKTITEDLNVETAQPLPERLIVPAHIIPVYEVSRRHAEVRTGPGLQFPIAPRHLKKHDKVILLYTHKYWMKIADPKSGKLGWVHKKTLTWTKPKTNIMTVSNRSLESVFVSDNFAPLYDYKSKKRLSVMAPKGHPLKVFYSKGRHLLVYLPSTNSVAWIMKESVR